MASVDDSGRAAAADDAVGRVFVSVTEEALDETLARRRVGGPQNGAVLVFHGVVRAQHEGRAVERVRYEAYVPMAEAELRAVAEESLVRHGVSAVAVLHRLGTLDVGEASLIVAVGSPHRREAFACGLEVIDALKRRAPIWKQEIGPGGTRWQEGVLPQPPSGATPSV